jgi:hypothetical protein
MKNKLNGYLGEYKSLKIPNEENCKRKRKLILKKEAIEMEIRKIICVPENIIPFLVPGRMIKIKGE